MGGEGVCCLRRGGGKLPDLTSFKSEPCSLAVRAQLANVQGAKYKPLAFCKRFRMCWVEILLLEVVLTVPQSWFCP